MIYTYFNIVLLLVYSLIFNCEVSSHDEELPYAIDIKDIGHVTLKSIHDQHPSLKILQLSSSDQDDISDIKNFTALEVLDISDNTHMKDISPLSSLKSLEALKAVWNPQIKNWDVLLSLEKLEELVLTDYPDVDFSFVKKMKKLKIVTLLPLWES